MKILIAPSILSADFGRMNEEIKSVERYVDLIHIDVMDGHFVPNLTFGAPVVSKMKCARPMDVHLMVERPENFIEDFAKAIHAAHGRKNDSFITVHRETGGHLHRVLQQIKNSGCRAGVALNPDTPFFTVVPVLNEVDLVLLMTVHPGFGGQKFMDDVVPKIRELRRRAPQLHIAVDGGINEQTAKIAVAAGADVLVAGSYIFNAPDRARAIAKIRMGR